MEHAHGPHRSPQIVGLEVLGVLVVCLHHWLPGPLTHGVLRGAYGAELLFVLAGFLGMRIVLGTVQNAGAGERFALGRTWLRGLVHGAPLFLLLALAVAALGRQPLEAKLATLTFTYNFHAIRAGHLTGTLAHLWAPSISVQFFLALGLLLWLLPRRFWSLALGALVFAGPASRLVLLLAGASQTTLRCASITSWDALAGGALVALLLHEHGAEWLRSRRLVRALPWVGLPLIALGMGLLYRGNDGAARSTGELFLITLKSPLLIWLVAGAAHGFRGPLGRLLGAGALQRLGTAWIGLYLFHAFAPLTQRLGPIGNLPWPLLMLVYAAFTVTAASLASLTIERPLRRWAARRLAPAGAITPAEQDPRQAA